MKSLEDELALRDKEKKISPFCGYQNYVLIMTNVCQKACCSFSVLLNSQSSFVN